MDTANQVLKIFVILAIVAGAFMIFFAPSYIARRHRHFTAIFIINLVFGATGIGWLIALIWSISLKEENTKEIIVYTSKESKKQHRKEELDGLLKMLSTQRKSNLITEEEYKRKRDGILQRLNDQIILDDEPL